MPCGSRSSPAWHLTPAQLAACTGRVPAAPVLASRPASRAPRTAARRRTPWLVASAADGFPLDPALGDAQRTQPTQGDTTELQEMAAKLQAAQEALADEQLRQRLLQPYLVRSPKCGIIGQSKYADKLRKAVVEAARDPLRTPVLVYGEPGLEKNNIAALLHFGSPSHAEPMASLECDRLTAAELFGMGKKPGLLKLLGNGTLLLSNVHQAPAALMPQIRELLDSHGPVRIICSAERIVPLLEDALTTILVPPLRLRPSDVADLTQYFLRTSAKASGKGKLEVTEDALRQLSSSAWPGNIKELEATVLRAASQASDDSPVLSDSVFWMASQQKDRYRLNLLSAVPQLRRLLTSNLWPDGINFGFTVYVYPLIIAALFVLPQDRGHNFALNVFWADWWPVIFLIYPFLGRIWCSVCPFMIYGELVQRWRLSKGAQLLKWRRDKAEKYGPWFLFALFAGILVWEEVWDLPNTAYLSAWLLLLITAGAMICSAIFERRLWCRYLCPIGGMNGLFAKLSMVELRARQGVCSSDCTTYHCYKGGPAEGTEGQETLGCPIYSHPAQLTDNKNCVLCMTCLKACPHRSVEVRLRVPGIDLWTTHVPSVSEVCLMMMLLGAVYLHRLPELTLQLGLDYSLVAPQLDHIWVSTAVLALPGVLCWAADAASRVDWRAAQPVDTDDQPADFVRLSYGYLPLVWAATLAHYLQLFGEEAGRILPVTAATFGLEEFGQALPHIEAHPAVLAFLQGTVLLFGMSASLLLTRKIGAKPWRVLLPQCLMTVGFTAELWTLIIH